MQIRKATAMWAAVLMLFMAIATALWAELHLKSIKVAITNPTDENRPAENIVLSLPELKKLAPDFYAGSQIVTASDASTVAEDAAALHPTELPSQVDDLDGDFAPDELAFQIDLKPHQTRIVTVTWGAVNRIFRLRGAACVRDRYQKAGTTSHGFGHACWNISFNPGDTKGVLAKHRKTFKSKQGRPRRSHSSTMRGNAA